MKLFPASVIKGAEEVFLRGSRNVCFLLFHGFTGYPGELEEYGRYINEKTNFSVYIPRLPGHATCGEDFLTVTYRDWLRKAIDSYADMKSKCDKVYVGGLSMGGLLTTLVASLYSPEKIILLAPAHRISAQKYRYLVYFLSPFIKREERKNAELPDTDKNDPVRLRLWEEYWKYDWVQPTKEFFKLQALAVKRLSPVKSNALIITSKADMTVPYTVADFLKERMSGKVKKLVLEKNPHVVVRGEEKLAVFEESVRWLLDEA
ncbi:MAG: alpha/beta fold hydrolase [Thermotogaceae bacterium]|nr:alpha/beta fold hydrolase [Thermotogaceae bacterium]